MGQHQVILRHLKFTFPQAREWVKWASERTSERCERTDERVAQYLHLDSCLFQTTVQRALSRTENARVWPKITAGWHFSLLIHVCPFQNRLSLINEPHDFEYPYIYLAPPRAQWEKPWNCYAAVCFLVVFFFGGKTVYFMEHGIDVTKYDCIHWQQKQTRIAPRRNALSTLFARNKGAHHRWFRRDSGI